MLYSIYFQVSRNKMFAHKTKGYSPLSFCPNDTISSLSWADNSLYLCATSWANEARIWNMIHVDGNPILCIKHTQPVLSGVWLNNNSVATAGADCLVKITDVEASKVDIIQHVCDISVYSSYFLFYFFSFTLLFHQLQNLKLETLC